MTATPVDILVTNGLVLTMDGEQRAIPGGAVAIRGDRITAAGKAGDLGGGPAGRVIDARGGIILPALVNTHTHAAMTLLVLVKFYEWMVKRKYAEQTLTSYLAVVKRFLIWLDANDHLTANFQVGKAVNRLRATRGNRRIAKAGREPDPGLARIVTYYDGIPLPSPDEKRGQIKRLEILRARAIVHTLYASAGRVSEVAPLTREMVLDGRKAEVRITGKGNKDRLLLLTKEAQNAIAAYCRERDRIGDRAPGLFVSHGRDVGKTLGRGTLWAVVKKAARRPSRRGCRHSPRSARRWRRKTLSWRTPWATSCGWLPSTG